MPYNLSFNLYSFTATAEDGLCIVEQILPYFQPDYTVTINAIPSMGIKRDVPITLNSVDYQDTYDGSFTNRRAVNYTMNFTAKTYLYGPIYSSKVIKETQTDIYTDTGTIKEKKELLSYLIQQRMTLMTISFTTTISTIRFKNYNLVQIVTHNYDIDEKINEVLNISNEKPTKNVVKKQFTPPVPRGR